MLHLHTRPPRPWPPLSVRGRHSGTVFIFHSCSLFIFNNYSSEGNKHTRCGPSSPSIRTTVEKLRSLFASSNTNNIVLGYAQHSACARNLTQFKVVQYCFTTSEMIKMHGKGLAVHPPLLIQGSHLGLDTLFIENILILPDSHRRIVIEGAVHNDVTYL